MHVDKTFDINYVDCSSLDTFVRCPFKYMLGRLMGVRQKREDVTNIALSYGKILHQCLPLCYTNSLDVVLEHFDMLWTKEGHTEDDKKRNRECAHLLLTNFWNNHHDEKCPYEIIKFGTKLGNVDVTDKASDNEIPFLIEINGPLPFAGRIDLPVSLKQDGTLWALDYKSTSEISERFFNGFENHPQALGYSLALSVLTNEPVTGFIVEAVRVAAIPKRPSTVPPNQWHPIHVPEHKLSWFLQWTNCIAKSILDMNEKKFWPRNPSGCCPYSMFGMPGYICQYRSICNAPEKGWQDALRFFDVGDIFHPFEVTK